MDARIRRHQRGTSGARLMEVVKERGVTFTVARTWPGQGRDWERRLKNQGGLSRHCPVCIAEGTDREALSRERRRRKREEEVPVAPPAPSTGPDYAEVEERVGEEFGKRSSAKGGTFRLYHGTASDFKDFEAGHDNRWSVPRSGLYFTDSLHAAREFGHRIVESDVTMGNPLDLRDSGDREGFERVLALLDPTYRGEAGAGGGDPIYTAVNRGLVQEREFVEAAQRAGYDGLIIPDRLGGPNGLYFDSYIAFSPGQVRVVGEKTAAPLHEGAKETIFYHGTGDEKTAQGILQNGIQPRSITMGAKPQPTKQYAPVHDRVYLTTSLGYAAINAVGGQVFGHPDIADRFLAGKDPYGYIFEVRGSDLAGDVVPDEDSIGEMLNFYLGYRRGRDNLERLKAIPPDKMSPRDKHEWDSIQRFKEHWPSGIPFDDQPINQPDVPTEVLSEVWGLIHRLTPRQREIAEDYSDFGELTVIGKKLQRYVSPRMTQWMLDHGAHAAHQGIVWPTKAWRIDKRRAIETGRIKDSLEEVPVPQHKAAARRLLPKGVRVTVKRERMPGPGDFYAGHIWKDYQYAGHCPVVSEIPSKAREAAIDWAWKMFPEESPRREKTASPGDSSITAEQAFPVKASLGKAAYDYKEIFRTIISELGAVDRQAADKASEEIDSWVNWGKRVLKKNDRIIWFLRLGQLRWADSLFDFYQRYKKPEMADRWYEFLKAKARQFVPPMTPTGAAGANMTALMSRLEHLLSLPIPEIQDTVFLRQQPASLLHEFSRLEKDWRDRQSHLLLPHEGDRAAVEFPGGWAWWVLDRSYCPEEARAMGHCGNEATGPSRPDDRILSLRRRVMVRGTEYLEPHLTFILGEDGLLGEMKGRGNDKPAPQYHPYIVRLLEQADLVRGIVGGGYMPEHNFSLDDLPPEQQERLKKANRSLVSASEMYSESRGNMTDELLQRITERTPLKKGQWSPEHEAFIVDEYANPEWFISTEGSGWLKGQMMLARGGFGKHPDHQVVEEGVKDLLAVLEDNEKNTSPRLTAAIGPGTEVNYRAFPDRELWGMLADAWEAGVTREMRQAALDRVRGFLGNNDRYNHVRTNDISRVAFPEANDPDFWKKPVLVEVSIEYAVHLASPSDSSYDEGRGYSGGEDTAIVIDDYWETSHGATLYDASAPYKKLTLPEDLKQALRRKMQEQAQGRPERWYENFLRGRPYEYLRWVRREIPAIFEQEMTPGAWDEEKARAALVRALGGKG